MKILNDMYLFMTLIAITLTNTVLAHDFGIMGHTFPIKEEPFVQMITKRLHSIDIAKHQEIIRQKTIEKINNPKPVEGLKRAQKNHSFSFDPTYLLKEDIIMPDGKVLYRAGTSINPLHYIDFDRRLIFIDARDKTQIKWLRRYLAKEQSQNRIILTGGKIFELEQKLNTSLYFDQEGVLVNHFGIKALPSVIVQEGYALKITELKI